MRYLIISCLLLLLAGCNSAKTSLSEQSQLALHHKVNPYFSDSAVDYVYKLRLSAYGRDLGGILVVKRTNENEHRAVLTTEFGAKVFDIEYDQERVVRSWFMDKIDKAIIRNILIQDIRSITREACMCREVLSENNQTRFILDHGKNTEQYIYTVADQRLSKIVVGKKKKERIHISFSEIEGKIANSLSLKHLDKKISIELVRIQNQ